MSESDPPVVLWGAAFGALAVIGFGSAFLGTSSAQVLYRPYETIVLPPSLRVLQLLIAIASAVSAIAYAVLLHWFAHAVSRALIVAQFILFTVATVMIVVSVLSLNLELLTLKQEPVTIFVIWHLRLEGLSVGSGFVVFAVNIGKTLVKVFLHKHDAI